MTEETDFDSLSNEDYELIRRIASRTSSKTKTEIEMDIAACHIRYGLDLQKMLDAEPFDFFHDLGGIIKNIDRETGELSGFRPRFLKKEKTLEQVSRYGDPVGDMMELAKEKGGTDVSD